MFCDELGMGGGTNGGGMIEIFGACEEGVEEEG